MVRWCHGGGGGGGPARSLARSGTGVGKDRRKEKVGEVASVVGKLILYSGLGISRVLLAAR